MAGACIDPAFERARLRIPPPLRGIPGARFTTILAGQKKPEGKDWSSPNGANYAVDSPVLLGYLAQGHNYGVATGYGGLIVLDIDDIQRMRTLGIIERLPATFAVRTGRGGLHLYYLCNEIKHKIILEDPELKDSEGDPQHLGELQAQGQQVVGPGSLHPNGNRYAVVQDIPIATITKAAILEALVPLKLTKDEEEQARPTRRRRSGGYSIGDQIPIDRVCWPAGKTERHGAEIQGSHPLHGSETGKNFSINTQKNCWHCFRHNSGGGPLEWIAVQRGIISCEDARPGCLR